MFVCLPLLFVCLTSIRRSLGALAEDTRRIRKLDFSERNSPRSPIRELDDLHRQHDIMRRSIRAQNQALEKAQEKLAGLVENGMLLSSERDKHRLLQHILMQGKRICNADAATLYLMTDRDSLRFTLRSKADQLPAFELPLHDPETGTPNERHVSTYVALRRETVIIDDAYRETRFDLSGTRRFDMESCYRTVSMLCVPLVAHGGEVLGVLQFMNATDPGSGDVTSFSRQNLRFVEALASRSARCAGDQLSIPAPIMAIADIFEALTASDRPYKKAKPLSESIRILARLRNRGPIDADLFALFLSSGVHLSYGDRHLRPEQLDQVDITEFLQRPIATGT